MRGLPALPGLLAALLLSAGCGGAGGGAAALQPAYPAAPDAFTAVAAENFYGDLLHQLGGPRVRVYSILSDPNADPHAYESNAGAAAAVADARLVVRNGLGYDAFMDHLLRASPRPARAVVSAQEVVGAPAGGNPHLWYDPTVPPRLAEALTEALVRVDPAGAPSFRANLQALLGELGRVTERVAELRARVAGLPVAFTEAVYGLMAAALGLDVRSPEAFTRAVEEGTEPPAAAVAGEEDLLRHRAVRALLYNSQTVTKVTQRVRALALASGVPVVGVSETEPPGTTFQAWQLDTLARLAAALGAP